jgi:S1-C subfamily serine protease
MLKGKNSLGCWIAGILSACLMISAAGAGLAIVFWPKPPVQITVTVAAPENIQADSDFNIIVKVTNNGAQTIHISEIRIPATITDIADPLGAEPGYMGINQQAAHTSFLLDQRIEAGATLSFTLKMHARQDGATSGLVEVLADAQGSSGDFKMAVVMPTTTPRMEPTEIPTAIPNMLPFASIAMIIAFQSAADGSLTPVWSGSGSVISPDGYILTNYHVAVGDSQHTASQLRAFFTDRQDAEPTAKYIVEVAESDRGLDLAVLRIVQDMHGNSIDPKTLKLPAIPIGNSDKLGLNDNLTIIGFPGIGGKTITETRGIVSGFTAQASIGDRAWIKTDTTIAGGDSGGAVLNDQGLIVGVPTRAGSGDNFTEVTDCRTGLADTNGDGVIDARDGCIPIGGFINALRPVALAIPLIERATGQKVIIPDEEPTVRPPLLFWDDFSNNVARWDQRTDAHGAVVISDGRYKVSSLDPNLRFIGRPHLAFQDLRMEIDAGLSEASTDGGYGLVCRYRNENNYYFFQIGPGTNAAIGKVLNGEEVILASQRNVKAIQRNPAANRLQAECQGDKLKLMVNGKVVIDARDSEWTIGDIGVFVQGGESGGTAAFFDNLFAYLLAS